MPQNRATPSPIVLEFAPTKNNFLAHFHLLELPHLELLAISEIPLLLLLCHTPRTCSQHEFYSPWHAWVVSAYFQYQYYPLILAETKNQVNDLEKDGIHTFHYFFGYYFDKDDCCETLHCIVEKKDIALHSENLLYLLQHFYLNC